MLKEEFLASYDASAMKETGRQEGKDETLVDAIERIKKAFNVTIEDACQTMGVSKEMYEKIKKSTK